MAGIFDTEPSDLFIRYRCRLQFRDRVVGGTPSNPRMIEGWLRTKMGLTQEAEVRALTKQTLIELGVDAEIFADDADEDIRFETLQQASEAIAKHSNTTMFKRDQDGLYLEARAVKAMLKEAVNILYAGERWNKRPGAPGKADTGGKAPRSTVAESVFVEPQHISLGVFEPSGIDLAIGHIVGPQGPRSTLSYYEYVERATIEFVVLVLKDRVDPKRWPDIWRLAQENALGAKRSQSMGQFDVLHWERLNGAH